jgi:hypothetical protein
MAGGGITVRMTEKLPRELLWPLRRRDGGSQLNVPPGQDVATAVDRGCEKLEAAVKGEWWRGIIRLDVALVLTGLGLSGSPLTSLACPKIYGVGFGWMRKNKNEFQGRHGSHNL